jgi:hypothetical protein
MFGSARCEFNVSDFHVFENAFFYLLCTVQELRGENR